MPLLHFRIAAEDHNQDAQDTYRESRAGADDVECEDLCHIHRADYQEDPRTFRRGNRSVSLAEELRSLDDRQDSGRCAVIRPGPETAQKTDAERADALDHHVEKREKSFQARDDAADQGHDGNGQ